VATAFVAFALLAFVVAHAVLAGSLAREAWWRAAVALFVAPLAVYWGWGRGMRRRVYVWCLALAAYALGVAIAGR
jgi:hypothetical protein